MKINSSMLRQVSALVPLAMSLAALLLVSYQLITAANSQPVDEGTAAHIFQLLIVGQAPFAAYFAAKWMPREPGDALLILALQAMAAVAALAPVTFFNF
jgi:hypothetical protein